MHSLWLTSQPGFLRSVTAPVRLRSEAAARFCARVASRMEQEDAGRDTLLAVVGDVHGAWNEQDAAAVEFLRNGRSEGFMTVFVGDFGNEDMELVRTISELEQPKVAILGNHDAWTTMRKAPAKPPAAALRSPCLADALKLDGPEATAALQILEDILPEGRDNGVLQQLKFLGAAHVGYAAQQVPGRPVSIVGVRPFSQGGPKWSRVAPLTGLLWGVTSMEASAARTVEVVQAETSQQRTVVLLSHNAQHGLGDSAFHVSGIDWQANGGDHGDPDLRMALDKLLDAGTPVLLVLCGHMHHKLHGNMGHRRMVHVDPGSGVVTLNAATVPRVRTSRATGAAGAAGAATERHFLLVQLRDGAPVLAHDTWVRVQGGEGNWTCEIASQKEVLSVKPGESGSTYRIWDAYGQCWQHVYVPGLVGRGVPLALA